MKLDKTIEITKPGRICLILLFLLINLLSLSRYSSEDEKTEINQALKEFKPFICKESLPYSRDRFNTTFIICIKDPSTCRDISTSFYINGFGRLRYGGGTIGTSKRYEEDLINIWLVLIKNYPEAVVLDFGSNIGAYTLASRTMGNFVIALDPDPENQALLYTSLVLNRMDGGIIQVRNAISDVYDVYYGKKGVSHGYMDLQEKNQKLVGDIQEKKNTWPIKSIQMSDIFNLVPEDNTFILKMDVQGFECRALTSYLKEENKIKFLPYILMETKEHCKKGSTTPCNWFTEFLPLLELSDYIPHVPYPITYEALKGDCYNDVLFVHKAAQPFPYLDPDLADADFRHTPDFPVPDSWSFFDEKTRKKFDIF